MNRSGQRQDELLPFLGGQIVDPAGGDALLESGGHDREAGPIQRLRDGGELAVATSLTSGLAIRKLIVTSAPR